MADSGPDISKIIGLIMENPDIIEKIRSLAEKEKDERETNEENTAPQAEVTALSSDGKSLNKEAATVSKVSTGSTLRRHELLCALKPYVSKKRAGAIDTALGIMDVLSIMKK